MKDELFIWFDSPPKVSKGAFNYVSKHWPNAVYFVINSDFRLERKLASWGKGGYGSASLIKLYEVEDQNRFLKQLFDTHNSAIHIINGFNSQIEKKIRRYIRRRGVKLVFSSERPVFLGGFFERSIRHLYYLFLYNRSRYRYAPNVRALLPLGEKGCRIFQSYGWKADIVFPFMYNPELPVIEHDLIKKRNIDFVRFLYVGRFSYRTKGVDILMKAITDLKGEWHLDMVGGYGDKANDVINWIGSQPRVSFLGTWDSSLVCEKMTEYDVVVVPTRFDGWNLLINEAVNAGIGVITTNEAISDEVIINSGSGLVVECNAEQFSKAMQKVIDNPGLIQDWHLRSLSYIPKISSESVGNYLMGILDYSFNYSTIKPQKPW